MKPGISQSHPGLHQQFNNVNSVHTREWIPSINNFLFSSWLVRKSPKKFYFRTMRKKKRKTVRGDGSFTNSMQFLVLHGPWEYFIYLITFCYKLFHIFTSLLSLLALFSLPVTWLYVQILLQFYICHNMCTVFSFVGLQTYLIFFIRYWTPS